MNKTLKACFLITCAILCKANAASYDCSKKLTTIEKMICSDSHLSELDSELALAYNKARISSPNRDALKAGQIHWIKSVRNKCHDIECLRKAYDSRLQEISHSSAASVIDDLNQTCRNAAAKKIEIFKTIAKSDPDLIGSDLSMGGGICDAINNMEIDNKDLNGDGQPELLVYPGFSCGAQNCPLFVFQAIGNRFKTLLSGTGLGIDILSSTTNGYSDLSIKAHDSAVSYEESTYNYNGNEYKQNECLFYRQLDDGRQVRERCATAGLAEPNKGIGDHKPMPQARAGSEGAGRAAAPAADTRQPPEASSSAGSGSATPTRAEDMARPGQPGWQAAEGTGCLVWNSEPGDRDPSISDLQKLDQYLVGRVEVEMVTWSGPCEGGRASGQGELVWRNILGSELSRYVGEMRDGKMNGYGRLLIKIGGKEIRYEGELRDDEPHGRGTLGFSAPGPKNLKSIEGDFVTSDQIAGPATLIWVNGDRYEGEIVQGDTGPEQNGRGKMTKANGDWYEGEWSGGFADGEGQAKIGDKKYSGVWARGCLRSTEQRAAWDVPRHECP